MRRTEMLRKNYGRVRWDDTRKPPEGGDAMVGTRAEMVR